MQNPIIIEEDLDGTSFRESVNDALSSVSTAFFGPLDPVNVTNVSVQPGFLWWDTGSSPAILKTRNADNTAWEELIKLDGSAGSTISTALAAKLNLSGGTLTGTLTLNGDPASALQAATKQYVDSVSRPAPIRFELQGSAIIQNKVAQVLIHQTCKIDRIRAWADTAPVGASLTVVLTRKRVSTSDDTRSLSITTGNNSADSGTLAPTMDLLAGDRIRLDVTSVGSGIAGGDSLLVTANLIP